MKFVDISTSQTSFKVSGLALGSAPFGTDIPEETAFRLMDQYADAGGNCIDSARVYADWLPGGHGVSEQTVGKWLKSRGNRNKMLISTKGGHPALSSMTQSRLSPREIESDLDDSLKALDVNEIDIYWLHRDDESIPAEEIMETLSLAVKKGKVRAVGCSNWKTSRIGEANGKAREMGFEPFSSSQVLWSLASITPEATGDPTIWCMTEQELAWYQKNRFPVFAYTSQANGFFAYGAERGVDALLNSSRKKFATPENLARLERVKELTARKGITATAAALGYILCNAVPGVAIVGCRNGEQLKDTLAAADVQLSQAETEWLFNG